MIEEIAKEILAELKKLNAAFSTVLAVDKPAESAPKQKAAPIERGKTFSTEPSATAVIVEKTTDPFATTTAPGTLMPAAPGAILGQAQKSFDPALAAITGPITREQCGVALVALATATPAGRDVAMAVLAKFNAQALKDVDPSLYPQLAAAIKEASNL